MLRLRTIAALIVVGLAGAAVASVAAGRPLGVIDTITDILTDILPTETTAETTEPATTEPATTNLGTTATEPVTTAPETTAVTTTAPPPTTQAPTTTSGETSTPPGTTATEPEPPSDPNLPSPGVTIQPASTPAASAGRLPPDVENVTARLGKGWVTIRWTKPDDPQFARVTITRTPGRNGQAQTRLYSGSGTFFRDRGLVDGAEYRYLVTAVSRNGARSQGIEVIVEGEPQLLVRPEDGARVRRVPPILRWTKVTRATYYNVQLFLGKRKVLSAWPRGTQLKLPMRWKYGKTTHRLVSGRYTWYVWPGFGRPAAGKYGAMLGASHFRFTRF
jgi:hypothetical protein